MIKLKVNGKEVKFDTTIFPDGTSQVWKIQDTGSIVEIIWIWENNEAELFHLNTLVNLIDYMYPEIENITLTVPYLPYARQDKTLGNFSTFSLLTFANVINTMRFTKVKTFDVHSNVANNLIDNLKSIKPTKFHNSVKKDYNPDIIFYPDKGALARYTDKTGIYGEKVRNQLTGEIEQYKIHTSVSLERKRILIIDDICDGGATFINAAKELYKLGAVDVGLCISHGIFSKGILPLNDAGIHNIYTTNSLYSNRGAFNVYE